MIAMRQRDGILAMTGGAGRRVRIADGGDAALGVVGHCCRRRDAAGRAVMIVMWKRDGILAMTGGEARACAGGIARGVECGSRTVATPCSGRKRFAVSARECVEGIARGEP
jgi:hypothetical protein